MSSAALLVALAMGAWPEHGRLVLSATAGGGWASDLYPGAGLGGGAMFQLAPAARLDASLAPRVKFGLSADAALTRFAGPGFGAASLTGAAEARWLADAGEVTVTSSAERTDFSAAVPAGALSTGPDVTGSRTARIATTARVREGAFSARTTVGSAWRASRADGADVGDRGLTLLAAASWAPDPRIALDVAAHHDRTESPRDAFAGVAWGGSAAAFVSPVPEGVQGGATVHAEWARFDTGATETAARLALDVSYPMGPVTALVAWSVARTWAAAPPDNIEARPAGTRQLLFVGVRGRERALSW